MLLNFVSAVADGAATARSESGRKTGVAVKQRQREVGCFLARAADPAGEGNMSDAEAWRVGDDKRAEGSAVGAYS
jgi:hypothetical protein